MINIKIELEEGEIRQIFKEEIANKLKNLDTDLVYWDRKELMKRTCLSWSTIQERFFYDPRFPKHKVGGKWLFPAEKTKAFLLEWLDEQPHSYEETSIGQKNESMTAYLPEILTAADIARHLNISKGQSYNILNRKDFPSITIGQNKRVYKSDFESWIFQNKK